MSPLNPMLILTAVSLEAKAIARALRLQKTAPHFWSSSASPVIHLHTIGIRAVHLPTSADLSSARGVILAGLAGALDPALGIADVLLDARSGPVPVTGDFKVAAIHTAGELISTPAQKAGLFAATRAAAVEMEASVVIKFLSTLAHRDSEAPTQLSIPFLHLRAISDTAADAIDPALLPLIDSRGNPRPLPLAAALLRRPTLIPRLAHLGRNSNCAVDALAKAICVIVDSGWPESSCML